MLLVHDHLLLSGHLSLGDRHPHLVHDHFRTVHPSVLHWALHSAVCLLVAHLLTHWRRLRVLATALSVYVMPLNITFSRACDHLVQVLWVTIKHLLLLLGFDRMVYDQLLLLL